MEKMVSPDARRGRWRHSFIFKTKSIGHGFTPATPRVLEVKQAKRGERIENDFHGLIFNSF